MKKKCVAILIAILVVQVLHPLRTEAQTSRETVTTRPHRTISIPLQKQESTELEDLRTADSKTFLQHNGSKQKIIYSEPVHYAQKNEHGIRWKNIDSTLVKSGFTQSTSYKNKANSFSSTIQERFSKGIALTTGNATLGLTLARIEHAPTHTPPQKLTLNQPMGVSTANTVSFKQVSPGTDITYYSTSTGVKEDITLSSYRGQNQFVFDLDFGNLIAKKETDGTYSFIDPITQTLTFTIPRPIMWDSAGGIHTIDNELSTDVTQDLVREPTGYKLVLTASDTWLSDPSRVFPITIDPSLTAGTNNIESRLFFDLVDGKWMPMARCYTGPTGRTEKDGNLKVKGTSRKLNILQPYQLPHATIIEQIEKGWLPVYSLPYIGRTEHIKKFGKSI